MGSARPLSQAPTGEGQGEGWDGALTLFAELATEARGAETLAADRVAVGSMSTPTHPLAASPVEARGTG